MKKKSIQLFYQAAMIWGLVQSCSLITGCDLMTAGARAANISVLNTNDSGPDSLRAAIIFANTFGSNIVFNIPPFDGTVKTITLSSNLPPIDAAYTIDGYTQPGATANTLPNGNNANLLIELNGSAISNGVGLDLESSFVTVRGLVINRFSLYGIEVNSSLNAIEGNFIGTDPTGTEALGNRGAGVFGFGDGNTIGGTTAASRNVISGNGGSGIRLDFGDFNVIQGNFIGTDITGTQSLSNEADGVTIGSGQGNLIGGTTLGAANRIAFNGSTGVAVIDFDGNPVDNAILGNSIFANGRLGIDLVGTNDLPSGVTTNDDCDVDFGPNNLQNYPILTSSVVQTNGVTIQGTLNSTSNTTFRIEFFANSAADPSGFGQGEEFLGFTEVTTAPNNCDAPITVTLPAVIPSGSFITATATDLLATNTSEFSQSLQVGGIDLTGSGTNICQSCRWSSKLVPIIVVKGKLVVQNVGNETAPATTTQIYLSGNASLDAESRLLGQVRVPRLEAGRAKSRKFHFNVPGLPTACRQYVIAIIDPTNNVAETDKTNNTVILGQIRCTK